MWGNVERGVFSKACYLPCFHGFKEIWYYQEKKPGASKLQEFRCTGESCVKWLWTCGLAQWYDWHFDRPRPRTDPGSSSVITLSWCMPFDSQYGYLHWHCQVNPRKKRFRESRFVNPHGQQAPQIVDPMKGELSKRKGVQNLKVLSIEAYWRFRSFAFRDS